MKTKIQKNNFAALINVGKKLILGLALLVGTSAIQAKVITKVNTGTTSETKWEKSKEGTWMGMDKTWYNLNPKDASVWMSKDGKKWDAVKNGMWQDKSGKWLKIVDKDLKWSADGGKTWSMVPDWTWEGANGMWNKFDKEWSLWTAKS